MSELSQHYFHDILEECYDVQLELEDARESYEILISDIELVVEEISEHLERIRNHLNEVSAGFRIYNQRLRQTPFSEEKEDLPWD